MSKIWTFNWWYKRKLRNQNILQYQIKIESELLKSRCLSEIQQALKPSWLLLKSLVYKLGIKGLHQNRIDIDRDQFEQVRRDPTPKFSQNQISIIRRKYWGLKVNYFIFLGAESLLYYLTASLFLPGAPLFMKGSLALVLSLVVMAPMAYGLNAHNIHLEALQSKARNHTCIPEVRKCNHERIIGYVLIAFSFGAVIFLAASRTFFLEHVDTTGLSPDKARSILKASQMASIFSFLVTIVLSLYLASMKQKLQEYSTKYDVLQTWLKMNRKRNDYIQLMIKEANTILLLIEDFSEKYWQLTIQLKKIFQMEFEHDTKYEELDKEYVSLKNQPGFVMNDHIYRKYFPIQAGHEELVKYGVQNAKEIREKVLFCFYVQTLSEQHISDQLQAIEPLGSGMNGKERDKSNNSPSKPKFNLF